MSHWFVWLQLKVFDPLGRCTVFHACNRPWIQKINRLCDTALWRSYPQPCKNHRFAALGYTRRFCFIGKSYCIEVRVVAGWSHCFNSHQLSSEMRTGPETALYQVNRRLFKVNFTNISEIVQLPALHFLSVINASCLHNESCSIF